MIIEKIIKCYAQAINEFSDLIDKSFLTEKERQKETAENKILKNLYKPMTAAEISKMVGLSIPDTNALCIKMKKRGFLYYKEIETSKGIKQKIYYTIPIE